MSIADGMNLVKVNKNQSIFSFILFRPNIERKLPSRAAPWIIYVTCSVDKIRLKILFEF